MKLPLSPFRRPSFERFERFERAAWSVDAPLRCVLAVTPVLRAARGRSGARGGIVEPTEASIDGDDVLGRSDAAACVPPATLLTHAIAALGCDEKRGLRWTETSTGETGPMEEK